MARRRMPLEPVGLDRVLTPWTAEFLQQSDTTMEGPPYRILRDGPTPPAVYEFTVKLREIGPLIWRRLWVPSHLTFAAFSDVLLNVMGWTNSHLHEFRIGKGLIGMADVEDSPPMLDERDYRLCDVKKQALGRLIYVYDFGDDWEHKLTLVKTLAAATCQRPHCLEGARACPPEDCGGASGYRNLIKALANPKHPEHLELKVWAGDDYDPDFFNVRAVNRKLNRLKSTR